MIHCHMSLKFVRLCDGYEGSKEHFSSKFSIKNPKLSHSLCSNIHPDISLITLSSTVPETLYSINVPLFGPS